jgi:GT2 family glycosyltransferase
MSVEQRRGLATGRRPPAGVEDTVPGGMIHRCCRLTDELLLLVASFPVDRDQHADLLMFADGSWQSIRSELTTFETAFPDGAEPAPRRLVLLHLDELGDGRPGTLAVRSKTADRVLEPVELERRLTSLDVLIADELSAAAASARPGMLDFLARSTADVTRSGVKLSRALLAIREALRERLPTSIIDPAEPRAITVDAIWRLDERVFYLEGWVRYEGTELRQLTAVSPEGERVELSARAFRYARPDVTTFYDPSGVPGAEKLGFIAYFETRAPSRLSDGWLVELREPAGSLEAEAPPVSRGLAAARSAILGDLLLEPMADDVLKKNHVLPAMNRVQRALTGSVEIDTITQFGEMPRSPEASVIVPLYKRVDFVEHQLAQFVHDPQMRESDLVYVLDSPELADHARSCALQLHRLYGLPFRLVTLTRNGGFSIANNAGASVASGRLLVLLNSDVLPETPGWLGRLMSFYDATPNIGALGPKLLYEDDSLQHAGLYFDRPAGSYLWANEHYYKGLHRDLPAANVARVVPAVTGACMIIAASLYRELGGLTGGYVQGDYEDSDLCLRLADAGFQNWYLPSIALYHLEGQSYASEERQLASQFNMWLHTYRWNDAIERIASVSELSW